jgi:UPF0042 nucleotide-binding protein
MSQCPSHLSVVIVTGLSGAGKNSILRALEDIGFETMDNPPLDTLEELVTRSERDLAIGVDARSRGFAAGGVLETLNKLRMLPHLSLSLVFATATDEILVRRYSETRRRHPLAQSATVASGIAIERALTTRLADAADVLIDTSTLKLPSLRTLIEQTFGGKDAGLAVSLISFAYPSGLPREADLVFDARFLRNPHYEETLRPLCGLDPQIGKYVEQDPDFAAYFAHILSIVIFLLPRFVQEGKKYATICIGCTGGQHRSVYMIEKLSKELTAAGWRNSVTHREAASFKAGTKPLETSRSEP